MSYRCTISTKTLRIFYFVGSKIALIHYFVWASFNAYHWLRGYFIIFKYMRILKEEEIPIRVVKKLFIILLQKDNIDFALLEISHILSSKWTFFQNWISFQHIFIILTTNISISILSIKKSFWYSINQSIMDEISLFEG